MMRQKPSRRSSFANLDPARLREIASMGGRAAHAQGKGHEFSSEEARQAGRLGGRKVSQNRKHMSEIGRRGGIISGQLQSAASRRRQPLEQLSFPEMEETPAKDD